MVTQTSKKDLLDFNIFLMFGIKLCTYAQVSWPSPGPHMTHQ